MAKTTQTTVNTTTVTVPDQLESAWLAGEMSHVEACAWMEEWEGSGEEY